MSHLARRAQSKLGPAALTGAVLLATIGLLASSNPLLAVAAPLVALLGWAAWSLPLRVSMGGLLFLCLLCEGLGMPLGGVWETPFKPLSDLLFVNLNSLTGIQAVRLPLADLLAVGLYVISSIRRDHLLLTSRTPSVRALNIALLVQFATVLLLDAWGTANGGNFNESLWQLRQLLIFPLRTVLALRAFDGSPRDLRAMGRMLVGVAIVKALVGSYFLRFVAIPRGLDVEFTTSHHDTLIFVPALLIAFHLLLEDFRWRRVLGLLTWVPIVFLGMIDNDRRLAWVSLGGAVIASLAMSPMTRLKRGLVKGAIIAAPLAVVYLGVGWSSNAPLFAGAQFLRGLLFGTSEASIDYRDIENFNVLFTWSQTPVLPLGFGHMFINEVPLPDISSAMPTWQYHPHNQYLWLFTIGGPVGFTLMFLPLCLGIFLAGRTYRRGGSVHDRVAALTIIGTLLSCLNQVFGDMGTLGFTLPLMGSLSVALASKMAVRSGAWPAPKVKHTQSAFQLAGAPEAWSPTP